MERGRPGRSTSTFAITMSAHKPAQPTTAGPRGWHSRGYLPHFDAGEEVVQFVTFRLADSVPEQVVAKWQEELRGRPEAARETELCRLVEAFLDTGLGSCHLRDSRVAGVVEGALLFFDTVRYVLHSWVVMPNHVHALFTPLAGWNLSVIIGSWKSFTSKEANKSLGRAGRVWQEDYFDRFIRSVEHYAYAVDYIECNPVKAGLCHARGDWPFGSARLLAASG
jgi:REP element-mobilizing transposase RayT